MFAQVTEDWKRTLEIKDRHITLIRGGPVEAGRPRVEGPWRPLAPRSGGAHHMLGRGAPRRARAWRKRGDGRPRRKMLDPGEGGA